MTTLAVREPTTVAPWSDPRDRGTWLELAGQVFQIPAEDQRRPDVQASVIQALNLCHRYGFTPRVHVHLIPFNRRRKSGNGWTTVTEYQVDAGLEAWKASADQQAREDGFFYVIQDEPMTKAQVKEWLGSDYREGCLGYRARVLRLDVAKEFQALGLPYEPAWVHGFYMVEEKTWQGKTELKPEPVPAHRTAADVARRRAQKHALKDVFTLRPMTADVTVAGLRSRLVEQADALLPEPEPPASAGAMMLDWSEGLEEEDGLLMETEPSRPAPMPSLADDVDFEQPAKNGNGNPAHGRLHAELGKAFAGLDVDAARHWLVRMYTSTVTPENVRESSSQLTDDEKDSLADWIHAVRSNNGPMSLPALRQKYEKEAKS